MHEVQWNGLLSGLMPSDPWWPSLSDLENLSGQILGPTPVGWVRRGDRSALIAKIKNGEVHRMERGARADALDKEFSVLAEQCSTIRSLRSGGSLVVAIAFFHLRFEGIHPLRDGNGRVGRFLMAAQFNAAFDITMEDSMRTLWEYRRDYTKIFSVRSWNIRMELLVETLARAFGLFVQEELLRVQHSFEPVFRDLAAQPARSSDEWITAEAKALAEAKATGLSISARDKID